MERMTVTVSMVRRDGHVDVTIGDLLADSRILGTNERFGVSYQRFDREVLIGGPVRSNPPIENITGRRP